MDILAHDRAYVHNYALKMCLFIYEYVHALFFLIKLIAECAIVAARPNAGSRTFIFRFGIFFFRFRNPFVRIVSARLSMPKIFTRA